MGKSKKKAETIFLVCEETGDYNYSLRRKSGGEKLRLKKYCPRLRRHTMHVEKKNWCVITDSRVSTQNSVRDKG